MSWYLIKTTMLIITHLVVGDEKNHVHVVCMLHLNTFRTCCIFYYLW